MAINKAQGQTLNIDELFLQCFSHGQLYVALSGSQDQGGCQHCWKVVMRVCEERGAKGVPHDAILLFPAMPYLK